MRRTYPVATAQSHDAAFSATDFSSPCACAGLPSTHKSELEAVFPGLDLSDMLIVPTCQRSVLDLVQTGEDVEAEKDFCLERFVEWSEKVCSALSDLQHWADYIDPCSGLPVCPGSLHSCMHVHDDDAGGAR